jgi:hypothetical protein
MNLEEYEEDIELAIKTDQEYEHASGTEDQLAKRLEIDLDWNSCYAMEIANAVFARRHAQNNPSPPSDPADTRLLNLISELDSSGNLKSVLRGLPSDVWFKLYNAVEAVGNGD